MYLLIVASLAIMFSCGSDNDDLQTGEITLNKTTLNLVSGTIDEEAILSAMGVSGELENVEWTSSNPSVAKVDSDGKITALSKGTAIITAKSGKNIATCEVKVTGLSAYYIMAENGEIWGLYKDGELVAPVSEGALLYTFLVSGNDIYFAGSKNNYPTMWKNGVETRLSNQRGAAISLALDGDKVHAGGYIEYFTDLSNGVPVIWSNGSERILADLSPTAEDPHIDGGVSKMLVRNGDVYAGGNKGRNPVIWKNGEVFVDEYYGVYSRFEDFCFLNNDLYHLFREESSQLILMKNQERHSLEPVSNLSPQNSSILTVNEDVYILAIANHGTEVVLFKNGQKVELSGGYVPTGTEWNSAYVHGCVVDNDLYIFEYRQLSLDKGKLTVWKNQEVIYIGDDTGIGVYSITLVKE
ncbi:Ig-like domain-containing protein [Dysgonomonas sp. 25]|uniref:Ig-like domain-containing protein n=1 Tax=Dysgonomonas sp. 25 TaxID=2302933 RepID=UPI001C871FE3|nr:Ig-like domain-containing protein [Dysgonomonas sp. 25]